MDLNIRARAHKHTIHIRTETIPDQSNHDLWTTGKLKKFFVALNARTTEEKQSTVKRKKKIHIKQLLCTHTRRYIISFGICTKSARHRHKILSRLSSLVSISFYQMIHHSCTPCYIITISRTIWLNLTLIFFHKIFHGIVNTIDAYVAIETLEPFRFNFRTHHKSSPHKHNEFYIDFDICILLNSYTFWIEQK